MLKRIVAILLLFCLAGSNSQRFFVYAGFELNHDYIAKNLCVNRNRPIMHCNGKCYFMKKLQEARDKEKNNARQDLKNRLLQIFWTNISTFKFYKFSARGQIKPERRILLPDTYAAIFKPPPIA